MLSIISDESLTIIEALERRERPGRKPLRRLAVWELYDLVRRRVCISRKSFDLHLLFLASRGLIKVSDRGRLQISHDEENRSAPADTWNGAFNA